MDCVRTVTNRPPCRKHQSEELHLFTVSLCTRLLFSCHLHQGPSGVLDFFSVFSVTSYYGSSRRFTVHIRTAGHLLSTAGLQCQNAAEFIVYSLAGVKPPKLLQTFADSQEAALLFLMFGNTAWRQIRQEIELRR